MHSHACPIIAPRHDPTHIHTPTHTHTIAKTRTRPPSRLGGPSRVVYLFGDPLASVASHYRRGIAPHQAIKTCGGGPACAAARAVAAGTFPRTFDEYVRGGEDLFGYERHFESWMSSPIAYDALFVRYDALFDPPVASALMAHAAAPSKGAAAAEAMAAEWAGMRRERRSRVGEGQRRQMYVELAARMAGMPPAFYRRAGGGPWSIEPAVGGDRGDGGGGSGGGGEGEGGGDGGEGGGGPGGTGRPS